MTGLGDHGQAGEQRGGGRQPPLRLLRLSVAMAALCAALPSSAQVLQPQQPRSATPSASSSSSGADTARNLSPVKGEGSVVISGGYARIVLLMDEYVPSTMRVSAGVLVVNFKRPVNISVERMVADLADYVSVIRRDPDGMGLRFALSRRVAVNTMEAGERLFIDLLPDGWRGPPPGLPQSIVDDLARRAREAEKKTRQPDFQKAPANLPAVTLRVGSHPTFTRFVFGLPEQGPVLVDRAADRLTLRFERPYPVDLTNARAALPWYIGSIESHHTEDQLVLNMVVAPQVDVRAFREESTYVLDLSTKDPRSTETPLGNVTPEGKPVRQQETLFPGESTPEPPKVPAPDKRSQADSPKVEAAVQPPPVKSAEETPPAAERPSGPVGVPNGPVMVQVNRQGDGYRIVAPFTTETPSAIFQRGDTLWLIFGESPPVDLSALQSEPSGAFRSVDATRSQGGTAIRIGLDRIRSASASRDGAAWIVTLADKLLEPPRPVSLARATGPNDRQLASADFEDPGPIHRVTDPLAGDELIVVTGKGAPRSFVRPQDYVEFSALQGAHGLVFQPIADDITVEVAGNRVLVTRPGGLTMSSGVAQASGAGRVGRRSVAAIFDPQVWRFDRDAPFNERQSELMTVSAVAHETQRTARRLDIARFYMAQDLWVEAKSVIDSILKQDKRTADDGSLQILKAIINTRLDRFEEALQDLNHVAVNGTQDAQLWRAVIQSKQGFHPQAMEGFKATDLVISSLPDTLRRDVLAQAAETALALHDLPEASRRLTEIEEMGPAYGMEQRLQFLQGRLLRAKGDLVGARTAFSGATSGTPSVWQADAELQLVLMDIKEGKLAGPEALEAFERMSYTWRGDHVEAQVLGELGARLSEAGRYRDAFNVLKTELQLYPTSEHSRVLQDKLMAQFEDIFLGARSKTMKPIELITLVYDFPEMVPQTRKGDEIMRQLADRMVEVDLLDKAAEILQHQISKRYADVPVARAQIAARLAMIHLMNRMPDKAIAALRTTRVAEMPAILREQRYLLEAQALGQLGRFDQAIDLVSEMKSREAQMAAFDLLWSAQRWPDAAVQGEMQLARWATDTSALTDADRKLVLRTGIAYAMAGDQFGLDRMNERYGGLLKGTPDERPFQVITAPIEARGIEFKEIARSLASTDTFDSFMENYRTRYPADMPGSTIEVPGLPDPPADKPAQNGQQSVKPSSVKPG